MVVCTTAAIQTGSTGASARFARPPELPTQSSYPRLARRRCQEARVKAEKTYRELPAGTPHAKKMLALKEWLLIALHTCMPCASSQPSLCALAWRVTRGLRARLRPDRVGIVRKLRLGMTLKPCTDGYELDMTSSRSHKTSRFCSCRLEPGATLRPTALTARPRVHRRAVDQLAQWHAHRAAQAVHGAARARLAEHGDALSILPDSVGGHDALLAELAVVAAGLTHAQKAHW